MFGIRHWQHTDHGGAVENTTKEPIFDAFVEIVSFHRPFFALPLPAMRLSGSDLADLIGCSGSTLSAAKSKGTLVYGRWDVASWAVHDERGTLKGYEVPDDCALLEDAEVAQKVKSEASATNSPRRDLMEAAAPMLTEERVREIMRSELQRRENPSAETEDYMRPAAAGGLSYVMARAVDGDSATARAAVMSAATLFGGLIGKEAADHWGGALVGAVLVGAVGWKALQTGAKAQESADAQEPEPSDLEASPDPLPESQPMRRGDGISAVGHAAA
jgi:hypothetical protein